VAVSVRSLGLLAVLTLSTGRFATASEPLGSVEIARPAVSLVDLPTTVVPTTVVPTTVVPTAVASAAVASAVVPESDLSVSAPRSSMEDLREVRWTAPHDESVGALASRWGLMSRHLVALNPELRGEAQVPAGLRLRVFEHDEATPTQSIGSPNKGRLRHGLPMPEGPYWILRERRTRAFGAENAIRAMITAFARYGVQLEDAPPVSVGEVSARRGGRVHPHRSHRTGRDVDLGYILTTGNDGQRWKRASADNFDVEKNWVLIQALVQTGEVQLIFMSRQLQRLLEPRAREQLSAEEFARYFRVPGQDPEHAPWLRHWDGHRDHMHVRFHCERSNNRCRSRSTGAKPSHQSYQ
jgi:murein endopeptidase